MWGGWNSCPFGGRKPEWDKPQYGKIWDQEGRCLKAKIQREKAEEGRFLDFWSLPSLECVFYEQKN